MNEKLTGVLEKVWTESIRRDYGNGLIVSESSLMAAFYHHARLALEAESGAYRVYTEPTFWWNEGEAPGTVGNSSRRCKPDVLIGKVAAGQQARAVAVIEFKYMPWYRPSYLGDIEKLVRISRSTTAYAAMIDCESGKEYDTRGPLASSHLQVDHDTQVIYAVIGERGCDACKRIPEADLQFGHGRFLHFTASVKKGTSPDFGTIRYE
jgi:hypothetical protein